MVQQRFSGEAGQLDQRVFALERILAKILAGVDSVPAGALSGAVAVINGGTARTDGDIGFTPTTPADWGTVPATARQALNELASVLTPGGAPLRYRQFVYEVSGGDFTFIRDGSGNPIYVLVALE